MNELTEYGDKRMTVKEVAEVLGVQEQLVRKHIREVYPDLMSNGVATYLNEEQITAIKQKMRPITLVTGAITDLEAAEMLLKSAEHFKVRFEQEHSARVEAEQRLAVAEPKAAFADLAMQSKDVLSMNDAAKVLKLGFGNITLFKKLRDMGILMDGQENNVPYQRHIAAGYFRVDESPVLIGDNIQIKRVTKVTQKGMQWLAKILEKAAVA
jgi:phage antirepressor YoqD-like protein